MHRRSLYCRDGVRRSRLAIDGKGEEISMVVTSGIEGAGGGHVYDAGAIPREGNKDGVGSRFTFFCW